MLCEGFNSGHQQSLEAAIIKHLYSAVMRISLVHAYHNKSHNLIWAVFRGYFAIIAGPISISKNGLDND